MMMSYAKLRNRNKYKLMKYLPSQLNYKQSMYLCVQFIISFAKIDNILKTLKLFQSFDKIYILYNFCMFLHIKIMKDLPWSIAKEFPHFANFTHF